MPREAGEKVALSCGNTNLTWYRNLFVLATAMVSVDRATEALLPKKNREWGVNFRNIGLSRLLNESTPWAVVVWMLETHWERTLSVSHRPQEVGHLA